MKNFAIATGAIGVLAAAALGLAGTAAAAPTGPGSASDIVKSLEAKGYNVMINGVNPGPLSECSVTAIHPSVSNTANAFDPVTPAQFTTVYVDISCPSYN